MTYLSIALSCVVIVAVVAMLATKNKNRRIVLMFVALAAQSSGLLIHARPWDYWVAAFGFTMLGVALVAVVVQRAKDRRRSTPSCPAPRSQTSS